MILRRYCKNTGIQLSISILLDIIFHGQISTPTITLTKTYRHHYLLCYLMATKEELDAAFQTAYQKAEEEQMRLHREEVERRKAHMARKRPATELEKSEGSPMKEASRSTEPLSLSHKKAIDVPNSPTSPTPSYRSLSDSKTKQPSFASTLIAAQKRSVKKSPTPTNSASNNPADSASTSSRMPPSWYVEMKTKSGQRKPETGRRELLERVKQICRHIQDCQGNSAEAFNEMRLYLHTMAFQGGINESILKDAKMLDNDRGLPQIMDNDIFPSDIKADAEELYNKWSLKDFNIDLLRNIKRGSKSSHIEDKDAKKPANIFGDNDLMCGQWWPTQLCTLRDGAHGSAQGGKCFLRWIDSVQMD